jgi:hypothetical protein
MYIMGIKYESTEWLNLVHYMVQIAGEREGRGCLEPDGENSSTVNTKNITTLTVTSRTSKLLHAVRPCIAQFISYSYKIFQRGYSTSAVRKLSGHFEYLENRSRGLDVTWQPIRGDLTARP